MIFLTLWKKDRTLFFGVVVYIVSLIGLSVWLYVDSGPMKDVVIDTAPSHAIYQENPVDIFEDLCSINPVESGSHDFNDGNIILLTSDVLCAVGIIGNFDLELMQQDLEVLLGKVDNITENQEYMWITDNGAYVMNTNQYRFSIVWWKIQTEEAK